MMGATSEAGMLTHAEHLSSPPVEFKSLDL